MGATLAGCLLMTSAASAAPRGDAAQEHRALLPGQEALVMTMLGASEGMDDCALEGASIERATISARYRCEALPELVTIELSPRRATERGTTTALFTLHASDTAPPSLVEALASRVRLDERSLRFAGATWQRMEPRHASHARFAFAAMFFGLLALALALEVGALRATPPVLGLALALATLSLLAPFIAGSLDTALAPDAARLPRALVGASLIARLIYLAHRRRDPAITARVDTRVAEMSGAERYEPIVFALCTLLVLFFVADTRAPLHLDTARDLLIARDCVEGTWCEHAGPMTSFGGLVQGALWSHVLESHRAFGASMGALETMVVVVLALSAALVALTARHGFGLKPSVTLFSLWLALTLFVIDHPTLWNPTMTPLTLAALHLAFVRGLRTGGTLAFTFAAMALALSMELHVAFAIFLPVFLCASVACANAPFAAALYGAAVLLELPALDSPGAFDHNAARIAPHLPLVVMALGSSIALGLALRHRIRARAPMARVHLVAGASCACFVALMLLLSMLGGRRIEVRYLAPVVTPGVILALALVDRRIHGRTRKLLDVGALLLLACMIWPRARHELFLRDVPTIARALYARASYGELHLRLRGPQAHTLLATLPAFEPENAPDRGLNDDLLILPQPPDTRFEASHPGLDVLELDRDRAAILLAYESRVDPRSMRVCAEARCVTLTVSVDELETRRSHGWSAFASPALEASSRAFKHLPGHTPLTYHLSLRAGETASYLHVSSSTCPSWRITDAPAVHGLPADAVALPERAEGELTFSVTGCKFEGWLPPYFELPPGPAFDPLREAL